MSNKIKLMTAAVAFAFAGGVQAASVASNNTNHTFATAMAIPNGYFDTVVNGAIELSTVLPHATVAAVSTGPFDYYKFTMGAGQLILDIDSTFAFAGNPGPFDPEIALWKANGTLLGENDDRGVLDTGSTHTWDSYLNFQHLDAGTYVVGVARFPSSAVDGGWSTSSNSIPAKSFYTLHISAPPVPEPGEWALMLSGLGLVGLIARRRYN